MPYDHRKIGAGITVLGFLALLSLRLWASPVAGVILGREQVSVVAFLGIPLLLAVVGAGIVIFVWGEELGLG